MHEPNYDSLSTQELQQLCHERDIDYDSTTLRKDLIFALVDADWEKSISQLNPE